MTDNCYQNSLPNFTAAGYVAGTPRTTAFCQVTPPWSAQTQLKISGVLPLPWDLQASGVYQNLPGVPILANLSYTNAQVAPSLGRDLSNCPVTTAACTATVNVGLLPTGALYEDRLSQVDARLTKNIRFGRSRLRGILDLYNLFNASTIVSRNNTFGPSWGRPTAILGGRLIKFAAQFDC